MLFRSFQSILQHCLVPLQEANALNALKEYALQEALVRIIPGQDERAAILLKQAVDGIQGSNSIEQVLKLSSDALDGIYGIAAEYLRRNAFSQGYQSYDGPLLGYRDFLFPMLCGLKRLSVMPQGKPIYVLLDDADNLNLLQTQVLNTWVSYRTGSDVSFKISTQLQYKTYVTTAKQRIETPHDFREMNVSSIHTGSSSSSDYPQWVEKVVQKRLSDHNIVVSVREFFPDDMEQERAIKSLREEIKKRWEADPRGYRPGDDAYRYARPDYIKSLGGQSKNRSTYRYAGFQQLVHISSGIIRFFLDNASKMYAEQEILNQNQAVPGPIAEICQIEPAVQDKIVRDAADDLMLGGFDKLEQEVASGVVTDDNKELKELRNLVRALGGIFQEILFSERSERRVFSIALSDDPPDDVMKVIRLGIRNGFFYEAAIGTKEGKWRTRRYVMTRRLAPQFTLDPMGFSGYLFVTTDLLKLAIENPKLAVTSFKENRLGNVVDERQLELRLQNG